MTHAFPFRTSPIVFLFHSEEAKTGEPKFTTHRRLRIMSYSVGGKMVFAASPQGIKTEKEEISRMETFSKDNEECMCAKNTCILHGAKVISHFGREIVEFRAIFSYLKVCASDADGSFGGGNSGRFHDPR